MADPVKLALISPRGPLYRHGTGMPKDLQWVDFKTRCVVFNKQARKGRLFSFQEGPGGEMRFDFHTGSDPVVVTDLQELDARLLEAYRTRVADLDG